MKKLILVLVFLFLGIGVIGFFYGIGAEPVNALLWLGLFGSFAVPCFALVGTMERVEEQEEQLCTPQVPNHPRPRPIRQRHRIRGIAPGAARSTRRAPPPAPNVGRYTMNGRVPPAEGYPVRRQYSYV